MKKFEIRDSKSETNLNSTRILSEKDRGCVEDQPQRAALREGTRKIPCTWFREVDLCGWSSTQPRSISP
jgi:hypothetical protein